MTEAEDNFQVNAAKEFIINPEDGRMGVPCSSKENVQELNSIDKKGLPFPKLAAVKVH